MKWYSTNGQAPEAGLKKAVTRGLAEDRGLYMPKRIPVLPERFFEGIDKMSFRDISFKVAESFFGEDVDEVSLREIVDGTLTFDCPVKEVEEGIWSLELFHGPTLAFKDVGARFMARLLRYFCKEPVNVLVATSGDTGSAVANGFLGVEGINVYVLYPKGKVSPIQECQFTTLGQNITAIEVDGVFDDCQRLVKTAFMDNDLSRGGRITSANSINVARFLPQSFYYFWAYAQMKARGLAENLVFCVPSGNFGNICSALFAHRMGLPVKRFIAANNANDVFYKFLQNGDYLPQPSIQTIANAMDVGDPSNFSRIWDLYGKDWEMIRRDISGAVVSDNVIRETIADCFFAHSYLLDPHGAVGYRALKEGLRHGETGVFCETAHPAKFKDTVEAVIGRRVDIPERLAAFTKGKKVSVEMSSDFSDFKKYLLQNLD